MLFRSLLQVGDPADLIEINGFDEMQVLRTFIDGELVAENGESRIERVDAEEPNRFNASPIVPSDIAVEAAGNRMRVIEAIDGQLVTREQLAAPAIDNGQATPDTDRDILKLVVVNRYEKAPPAVAFITGFELTKGALASSVAHDSHNIVAVGASDREICRAINAVVEHGGGLSLARENHTEVLPLPVAGLMSTASGANVADKYTRLDQLARESLGSTLGSPYMTLSFMALLVIPQLKLSDRGLFDGEAFEFVPLFA